MTTVTLKRDGRTYEIRAEGHATGSVQACAAVSTLLTTIAVYLHNAGVVILGERLQPGDALLRFTGGSRAAPAFDFAMCGFHQIGAGDPEHVRTVGPEGVEIGTIEEK